MLRLPLPHLLLFFRFGDNVLHFVFLVVPLEVVLVLLEAGEEEIAVDHLSFLLKAFSDGLFAQKLHPLNEGEIGAVVKTLEKGVPDDLFPIVPPRLVLVMRTLLQLLFLTLRLPLPCWNIFSFASEGSGTARKEGILGAVPPAGVGNVLANASQRELVPVLRPHSLAESLKLRAAPFEFVVPVTHLPLREVEESVELLIGRGDEAELRAQVAEDILEYLGKVGRREVLDEFYEGDQLGLFLLEERVLPGGISAVDVEVLVLLATKLYALLYVFGEGVLRRRTATSTALETAVSSQSTPTARRTSSQRLSFCRRSPSEQPRSMNDSTRLSSITRLTSRWRIWFMDMPRWWRITEWSSRSFSSEIYI